MAFRLHTCTATIGCQRHAIPTTTTIFCHHRPTPTVRVGDCHRHTGISCIAVPMMPMYRTATIKAVVYNTNVAINMVVDTGAALSIVDSANVTLYRRVQVAQTRVVGISNTQVEYSEVTSVFFKVGGGLFQQSFAVVDNLMTDYILGNDFLAKHCVVVDYLKKEVRIHSRARQN